MRGGTSKGVFFNNGDLPADAQHPGAGRDALLQRIIGGPTLMKSRSTVWVALLQAPVKR